ncbi:hypothetical protein [Gordonia sp. (in: high G+C Gram-positive bacteria)]|uniref:hypothetical protein n=1 Tax=Gordonia sp. (in: high G+C Gram-positive bacteria) TaxID=84139 RepID=UPI003C71212A
MEDRGQNRNRVYGEQGIGLESAEADGTKALAADPEELMGAPISSVVEENSPAPAMQVAGLFSWSRLGESNS